MPTFHESMNEFGNAKQQWQAMPEVLLFTGVPQPLHGVAPRIVLGRKWWDAERKAAYKSTDHHCIACCVHRTCAESRQWMEGHEVYTIDFAKGRMKYVRTVPLCHYCHNYCHQGRLQWLVETGKLHHSKYASIIQHGDRVLLEAGLERKPIVLGVVAPWSKWRLVIGRKTYPPLHASAEEQAQHYKGIDE